MIDDIYINLTIITNDKMKQNLGIALDPKVVDELDRQRGLVSRSAFVENHFMNQIKERIYS